MSLIRILERQQVESDTRVWSEVSDQRERNHRYYAMGPLGNERRGYSHYIDPRVFSSVEDKKAVFHETFLGSRQVVKFNCQSYAESLAKTAYAIRVLEDNDHERLLPDCWHDAMVAKRATVWLDWRRSREEVTLEFNGATTDMVNAQLQQLGQVVGLDESGIVSEPIPSIGVQQYVHTGVLVAEVDRSYIDIDLIQPEYVARDPEQAYAKDSLWNSARMDVSRIHLVDMGFDKTMVDELDADYQWKHTEEDRARSSHERQRSGLGQQREKDQQEVSIYKTRTWLYPEMFDDPSIEAGEFEPRPGPAIYEIYWGAGKVLRWNDGTLAIKVLDEMDVYEWSEFKVSHSEFGMCTADVEAHQQKAGSGLKRGVMDNMNIVNNPRWEVNGDAFRDLRDIEDNLIGGIAYTDGRPPGNIAALPQPQLSPLTGMVMQMLDRDSEKRSGMSDLSRGLNQDAIAHQNAEDMVDKLSAKGERRVAMEARDFAKSFMVPLMQGIVRLGRLNDRGMDSMESGGQQVPIAPSQWSDDDKMQIEVALTPWEAQQMAVGLMGMDERLRQDPEIQPLYGMQQKHTLWDTVFELMGVKDSTPFLANPNDPATQQMLAQRAQEAQMAQQKQDQVTMFQMHMYGDQSAQRWAEINSKQLDRIEDNERADDELDFEVWRGTQEVQLEREQKRAVDV